MRFKLVYNHRAVSDKRHIKSLIRDIDNELYQLQYKIRGNDFLKGQAILLILREAGCLYGLDTDATVNKTFPKEIKSLDLNRAKTYIGHKFSSSHWFILIMNLLTGLGYPKSQYDKFRINNYWQAHKGLYLHTKRMYKAQLSLKQGKYSKNLCREICKLVRNGGKRFNHAHGHTMYYCTKRVYANGNGVQAQLSPHDPNLLIIKIWMHQPYEITPFHAKAPYLVQVGRYFNRYIAQFDRYKIIINIRTKHMVLSDNGAIFNNYMQKFKGSTKHTWPSDWPKIFKVYTVLNKVINVRLFFMEFLDLCFDHYKKAGFSMNETERSL